MIRAVSFESGRAYQPVTNRIEVSAAALHSSYQYESVQETPQGTSENQPARVIVVEDHPLLASAIAGILESEPGLTVCGIARNGSDAAPLARQVKADVALLDFRLPDMSGPAAAGLILAAVPGTAIVFHGAGESESDLLDAIDAGATAFLTKSAGADEIVEAVRGAARGKLFIPVGLCIKAIARQKRVSGEAAERLKLVAQFTPRELMQPYWAFREPGGSTLYVPAVAF